MNAKPRRGAPSLYSDALAQVILDRVATGESLRSICEDDDMPALSTIIQWLAGNRGASPDFAPQYARSKELGMEAHVNDMLRIAQSGSGDVNRDRLVIDVIKWQASKLAPKRYGDRITQEISGRLEVAWLGQLAVGPAEASKRLKQGDP